MLRLLSPHVHKCAISCSVTVCWSHAFVCHQGRASCVRPPEHSVARFHERLSTVTSACDATWCLAEQVPRTRTAVKHLRASALFSLLTPAPTMAARSAEVSSPPPSRSCYTSPCSLRCPACDVPLRSAPSPAAPVLQSCGHCVCSECDAATQRLEQPFCAVCKVKVSGSQANVALGAYAEALLTRHGLPSANSAPCQDCATLGEHPPEIAVFKCCVCSDQRVMCQGHAAAHARICDHAIEGLSAGCIPAVHCVRHPDSLLKYFCMLDGVLVCAECVIAGHPMDSHDVRDVSESSTELLHTLHTLMTKCAEGVPKLQCQEREVRLAAEAMDARFAASVASYRAVVARVKAALDTQCSSVIAAAEQLLTERRKALDVQADALGVSVCQLSAVTAVCNNAVGTGHPLAFGRAIESMHGMSRILAAEFNGPCVAPVVEIVSSLDAVIDFLPRHTRMLTADVDAETSTVEGCGIEHYVVGDDSEASHTNVVTVTCKDSLGNRVLDVAEGDVALTVSPAADASASTVTASVMKCDVKGDGVLEFTYRVCRTSHAPPDMLLVNVTSARSALHIKESPFSVPCTSLLFPATCIFKSGDVPCVRQFEAVLFTTWLPRHTVGSLLYRASRDGAMPSAFHTKCDNKGATLVLIRSTNGCVFGGYSNAAWSSNRNTYIPATSSFLFSVVNPHNTPPFKLPPVASHTGTIYCSGSYMPTFGSGHDLHIDAEFGGGSSAHLPCSYQDVLGRGGATFTGAHSFTPADVEVWSVLPHDTA